MHCPFFMRQSMMALCAQLAQFDEELYKVPAGSAPIAAQHGENGKMMGDRHDRNAKL